MAHGAASAHRGREDDMSNDGATRETLGAIAHELQTPLHVITGYSRLLLDQARDRLAPAQCQMLERISSNARGLSDLINRMMESAAA
jgi:signal transduction histidine kinase